MQIGLVSIITPCFNGETFLERYFKSVLNQTYKKIEIIFINDGSTDRTEQIAMKYKDICEKNKIKFIYIYQKNQGQAAAINKGLKIFNGEFLTWPDSDDLLYEDSIEKRVEFLNKNKQYGLVRNSVKIIDEETKKQIGKFRLLFPNKNIFEDLIIGRNIFYSPISYMVRTSEFIKTNPSRKIFETRYGQNWQILLPISYYSKCGYIKEFLCEYYVRNNSHSREKSKNLEEEIYKQDKHQEILENVLSTMNIYNKYKKMVIHKFLRLKLKIAYDYNNYEYGNRFFNELKEERGARIKDVIKFYAIKHSKIREIIKIIKK